MSLFQNSDQSLRISSALTYIHAPDVINA